MASSNLYTIGYEGASIGAFVERLRDAAVDAIVDVRELPLSRKRGFSKHVLADRLRDAGIGYLHMRGLGCPRPIRTRYRNDGSWSRYTRDFLAHLAIQREPLESLVAVSRDRVCCLLCFEADFNACHRTYVARAAHDAGAPPVVHLRVGAASRPDVNLVT